MTIDPKKLPTLKLGSRGPAVKAAKITLYQWDGKTTKASEFFGVWFRLLVKEFQADRGIPASGVIGPVTWKAILRIMGPAAKKLLEPPPSVLLMVHPIPKDATRYSLCQGLHETGGLAGNWAIDLCVANGTPVLACEAGTVTKLSGRSPSEDTWDASGTYGWTVYFTTPAGYRYFVTHLGSRSVKLGQKVYPGTRLGFVGDQRFRPDHVHYGVTSPKGETDARRHIMDVANAARI